MFPESHDTQSRNNVSRKVIPNINYTAREKVFTYISSGNRHNQFKWVTTQSSVIGYCEKIIQINVDQSMYNFKARYNKIRGNRSPVLIVRMQDCEEMTNCIFNVFLLFCVSIETLQFF